MPSISTILLVLAAVNSPYDDPHSVSLPNISAHSAELRSADSRAADSPLTDPRSADPAGYRAAFDDSAAHAPTDAWPPEQQLEARPAAAVRPAHLPIQFRPATQVHHDPAVRRASVTEPAQLPTGGKPLLLAPPSQSGAATTHQLPTASVPTVLGSLGAVIGLFLIVAWVMRRGMPKGSGMLPREVVEVLGRTPLAGRQQMHLLRLGNKLVLVSMSPGGVETLAEVTDALEVDRLTGLCYQKHPHGSTATFGHVLQSFEDPRAKQPAARGSDRLDLSSLDALARVATGKEGQHAR